MKLQLSFPGLTRLTKGMGIASLTALSATASISQPSLAEGNRFFCGTSKGTPATLVRTARGSIPMIRWVSNNFSGSRYTPRQRCQDVSARFQRFNDNGTLKFIRTGSVNRYPVLCVANSTGGNCASNSVLVTLRRGSDAQVVLQRLLDLRARAAGRTLRLSGSQAVFYEQGEAYVDIEKLLNSSEVE